MLQGRLSQSDFKRMRGFKRLQGRFFSLSFGSIPGRKSPGMAVVVSAKALPGAVRRNALKRRCRVVFRDIVPKLSPGAVYVLHTKKGSGAVGLSEIRADIHDLVARARLAR